MRKFFIALLVSFPVLCIGQTDTENYVKSTAYRVATQDGNVAPDNKQESITYYDGLGRAKQSIAVRAGGQGENIVNYVEYDALGRTPKQYLPYATDGVVANPLDFMDPVTLKANIENFYNTDKYELTQNPFSEVVYEASPLNKVLEQASPGNSWALDEEHTIKMDYQSNEENEVRYFDVNFIGNDTEDPTLVINGYYSTNELYKNITKDENWTVSSGNNHTTEEFTNKSGQVVLKRTYDNNLPHDTYYVYDDFGNLTYVLSPEASIAIQNGGNTQDILDNLGYQYKYDYRNRLVEKKIPGKGWEFIVYNKLDQPVLTQDANQRANSPKEWLFTKYDAFGRVAYTGIKNYNSSRTNLQNAVNNANQQYETRTSSPVDVAGTQLYYTKNAVPTVMNEILTVNYYDDYIDTAGMQVPETVYSQLTTESASATTTAKGLPTVSKVRVLGTDNWITSITGYDQKGRAVYAETKNTYLQTHDSAISLYDFTGNVLESTTIHQKEGHQTVTTVDYFTYDHQNRLLTHLQQIDNEDVQLIASNSYDELGQLEHKHVGGTLWEDGYTGISSNLEVTAEGVITKISGGSAWNNAGLSTQGVLDGDGGLSFTALTDDKRFAVGLNNTDTHDGAGDLDYSFAFYWPSAQYRVRIIEAGTPAFYITGLKSYDIEDTFSIEREDNTIYFFHNGLEVGSYIMNQQYNTLVGDIAMRDEGASINNLNFYPTTIDRSLQQVDYKYNVRGWLTDINDVNSPTKADLFNFHINYDGDVIGDAAGAGKAEPLYNGNISQTVWQTRNPYDSNKRTYGYKYDALNRIKQGYSRKGNTLDDYDHYNVSNIAYDQNGNILNLTRQGNDANDNAQTMDALTYHYNGNQLEKVDDGATTSIKEEGFFDGNTAGDDYVYDINGNMVEDKNKGITSITYNHLNLPESVTINTTGDPYGQAQNGTINYVYDATGVKLAKIVQDNLQQQNTLTTSYAGGYIYEKSNTNYEQLKMIAHPEGYIEPVQGTTKSIEKFSKATQENSNTSYQYAFNYTDHLGNVRLTYADSDGDGAIEPKTEIISEKNYYPFGLQHKGYNDGISSNVNSIANKFAFNGKENNPELGLSWIDYGARNYDASLGRWMNIDPLAEVYYGINPYAYVFNNPVQLHDPDGMRVRFKREQDQSRKDFRQSKREFKKKNRQLGKESKTHKLNYKQLRGSENTHTISFQRGKGSGVGEIGHQDKENGNSTNIIIDLDQKSDGDQGNKFVIAHELAHAVEDDSGRSSPFELPSPSILDPNPSPNPVEDIFNNNNENRAFNEEVAGHIENVIRGEVSQSTGTNIPLRENVSFRVESFQNGKYSNDEIGTVKAIRENYNYYFEPNKKKNE